MYICHWTCRYIFFVITDIVCGFCKIKRNEFPETWDRMMFLTSTSITKQLLIEFYTVFRIQEGRDGFVLKNRLRIFFFFCKCNIHGFPITFRWRKTCLAVIVGKRGQSQNMCPTEVFFVSVYRGKRYFSY